MEKLNFIPKKIEYKITKDSLCAVSKLSDVSNSRDNWMVVGGMATQGYLPTNYRRPTSDLDLSVVKALSYTEFKEYAKPILEYLKDNKYTVETHKASRSYNINIQNSEDKEAMVIELSRRNESCLGRSKIRLEREIENSRKKTVEDRNEIYVVSSPEDIAVPKLVRGVGTLKRNPDLKDSLINLIGGVSEEYAQKTLEQISYLRGKAHANSDPKEIERIRLMSDVYDIRVLSSLVGFNQAYLAKVVQDWDVVKEYSPERVALFDLALAKF